MLELASVFHQPLASPASLVVLGSTGSIGRQTLQVLAAHPHAYRVLGLGGHRNVPLLLKQTLAFQPEVVSVAGLEEAALFETLWRQEAPLAAPKPKVLLNDGEAGLSQLATWQAATHVLVGVVGMAGLAPTLAALQAGKRVMTANKETFVAGGHLVQPYLPQILPLDSEHSSLFQCLHGLAAAEVSKLWLTASGGPFRTLPLDALASVSPAQALKHPKWSMGQRISIDSATLLNKGLEVIEAHWQFGISPERLAVVLHPQSIVHAMVELVDGTYKAHLGPTDMQLPLQYGLSYPQRWGAEGLTLPRLSPTQLGCLEFDPVEADRFPCLGLALAALEQGPWATCILNAADEALVADFLEGRIPFTGIATGLEAVLATAESEGMTPQNPSLCELEALYAWAQQAVMRR